MTLPVRHLPVLQNWDCHGCTDCCREYVVHITDEERMRIEEQGWSNLPEFQGVEVVVREGSRRKPIYRLAHRADGSCVFLGEGGRCRIHEKFGGPTKPLGCRVYPFMLVPTDDHWRVGLRFACPSAAGSKGRPLSEHAAEVKKYVAEYETREFVAGRSLDAPPLQGRQTVPWSDLYIFVQGLGIVLGQSEYPIERRLRKCLALAKLCRQAKFDKLTGERLQDFLSILIGAVDDEVPADPATLAPPSRIGRLLFRQILVLYARKDTGMHKGRASRNRLSLLAAAIGFARGSGKVPPINALLPETTFEKLEEPAGPLPVESAQMLERYFLMKVHSMQFVGATNFHLPFWDGLDSLILSFPIAMWLARALSHLPRAEAVQRALRIADDSFGFHPLLSSSRQKLSQRILSFRGEIPRLVAWYGR